MHLHTDFVSWVQVIQVKFLEKVTIILKYEPWLTAFLKLKLLIENLLCVSILELYIPSAYVDTHTHTHLHSASPVPGAHMVSCHTDFIQCTGEISKEHL